MNPSLLQALPGPFNFLRPDPEELRRIMPEAPRALPLPGAVFLEDEAATPLRGFPVLLSPGMVELRNALRDYVLAEEGMQVSILTRAAADRRQYAVAWERYRALFVRAFENSTLSNYGRQFPGVFWLHHSLEVARLLKETPKRVLRQDLETGRRHGDAIKYRVLERYLDRVLQATYDVVQRLAGAIEESEEALFPRLLTRMRDNVLVFSEDHISRDLAELGSYFNGYLRLDGRDLRARLEELARWHAEQVETDRELRAAVSHLLGVDPRAEARDLLLRSGYVAFLATRRAYNPARLLPPEMVPVWEGLLTKLKEFEVFHAVRRALLPVERRDGQLLCRDGAGVRRLSPATRPFDFLEPWVVDPRVARYGMIYDVSEFSQTISVLHRAGSDRQDDAFRRMFRFQRRINRLAQLRRAKLEKYLGDGAFYSSRDAANLLACALHIQRTYRQAIAEGFPFDRGLRIALNFGHYRLIPMGGDPEEGERYEFFGHGLVELSRLVTGKATREIEEVKNLLLTQGYPETAVHRFFAPIAQRNLDLVDKREESRPFYAYLDQSGALVNNGLVATGPFVAQLTKDVAAERLYRAVEGGRRYVVVSILDAGEILYCGIRRLGLAHLKGLEKLAVYELVDGADLAREPLPAEMGLGDDGLLGLVDRDVNGHAGLAEAG